MARRCRWPGHCLESAEADEPFCYYHDKLGSGLILTTRGGETTSVQRVRLPADLEAIAAEATRARDARLRELAT